MKNNRLVLAVLLTIALCFGEKYLPDGVEWGLSWGVVLAWGGWFLSLVLTFVDSEPAVRPAAAQPARFDANYEEHQRWLVAHGVGFHEAAFGTHTTWVDVQGGMHEGVEYISKFGGCVVREHAPDSNGKYHWI